MQIHLLQKIHYDELNLNSLAYQKAQNPIFEKKLGLAESRLNTAAVKRGEGERVMVEVNAERSIPLIEIRF